MNSNGGKRGRKNAGAKHSRFRGKSPSTCFKFESVDGKKFLQNCGGVDGKYGGEESEGDGGERETAERRMRKGVPRVCVWPSGANEQNFLFYFFLFLLSLFFSLCVFFFP